MIMQISSSINSLIYYTTVALEPFLCQITIHLRQQLKAVNDDQPEGGRKWTTVLTDKKFAFIPTNLKSQGISAFIRAFG